MQRDLHYTIDEKQKAVLITDDGYEAAEDVLQVPQRPAARPSTVEPLLMGMAMLSKPSLRSANPSPWHDPLCRP